MFVTVHVSVLELIRRYKTNELVSRHSSFASVARKSGTCWVPDGLITWHTLNSFSNKIWGRQGVLMRGFLPRPLVISRHK